MNCPLATSRVTSQGNVVGNGKTRGRREDEEQLQKEIPQTASPRVTTPVSRALLYPPAGRERMQHESHADFPPSSYVTTASWKRFVATKVHARRLQATPRPDQCGDLPAPGPSPPLFVHQRPSFPASGHVAGLHFHPQRPLLAAYARVVCGLARSGCLHDVCDVTKARSRFLKNSDGAVKEFGSTKKAN
ncbi:hypothetical protein L596_011838 [Steinernema carpocapsae]|uniref:Uncharacterized protein n=1 Tax=Steinernema carpocapsae TaxID=34508 RepID=A0A4U5NVX1_STECR|nr:hypothetical protein L596_011838 [Steinernema carpocapsae]